MTNTMYKLNDESQDKFKICSHFFVLTLSSFVVVKTIAMDLLYIWFIERKTIGNYYFGTRSDEFLFYIIVNI
jgi:hypothetical protein